MGGLIFVILTYEQSTQENFGLEPFLSSSVANCASCKKNKSRSVLVPDSVVLFMYCTRANLKVNPIGQTNHAFTNEGTVIKSGEIKIGVSGMRYGTDFSPPLFRNNLLLLTPYFFLATFLDVVTSRRNKCKYCTFPITRWL